AGGKTRDEQRIVLGQLGNDPAKSHTVTPDGRSAIQRRNAVLPGRGWIRVATQVEQPFDSEASYSADAVDTGRGRGRHRTERRVLQQYHSVRYADLHSYRSHSHF